MSRDSLDYSRLETLRLDVLANPDSRDRLVDGILRCTDELCARVARWCNHYRGLDWARDGEDLTQIVRMVELTMLNHIIDEAPGFDDLIPNWEAALRTRARSAIAAYADSPAVTGISGNTANRRRQRAIAHHRQQIDAARQDPATLEEVVASYNAQVAQSRKNPSKQSAFATSADLADPATVIPAGSDHYTGSLHQDDFDQVEASLLIEQVVQECVSFDPLTGDIARVWLSWYPDNQKLTTSDVVRRLGISRFQAETGIKFVRSAFQRALVEAV